MITRTRIVHLVGGALAAIALLSLMGPVSGGFPSRPRFQAVGIGVVAPAAGQLSTSGDITVGNNINLTNSSSGIEHGARGAANTPFIDFHSGAVDADFDTRILASGGTGSSGGGTLTFTANGATIAITDFARLSQNNLFSGASQALSNTTNPAWSVTDTTATVVSKLQSLDGEGLIGTESAHPFSVRTSNAQRILISSSGIVDVLGISGALTRGGNLVWDAANDGAGSGLDADTLDALSSAAFVQQDAARTNFVARSGSVTSRTSDATNTCDANLTLSLPNATADYSLYVFLDFDGNGITANGWSVLPQASTGTITVNWVGTATTNTTAANASATSNTGASGGDMDAVFNAAGVATYVTISGVVRVTAGSAPAICIAWGQTASNATATDLNIGSNMVLTRLN